jgi:predicted DCC family thiol-disulfide oxidoreductase YuxK
VRGPRIAVIYDGACPLCRGSVEWIRTRDRAGAFAFVPFQDPGFAERFPQVPLPACEQAVTLVLPDGSLRSGADALPEILRRLPRWRLLAPLLGWRAVRPLARRVYNHIAARRLRDTGSALGA